MLIDDFRSAIRAKNYSKKTFEASPDDSGAARTLGMEAASKGSV